MRTNNTTASKRILAWLLCIIMVFGMMPMGVAVAEEETGPLYAQIVPYTDGNVTGNETDDAKLSVSNVTLEWVAADETAGRTSDGWWVGINVIAPDGAKLDTATYQRKTGENTWTEAIEFKNARDTEDSIQLWGLITEEYLKSFADKGRNMNYVYRFDWNGDQDYGQMITITVDPNSVTLNKDGAQVYPAANVGFGDVQSITAGADEEGTEADVKLMYSALTLDWVAADSNVGRDYDGWWVGMQVTAPDGVDLTNAKFQRKTGADTWGTARVFGEEMDSENSMGLWGLITEAYLESFTAQGRNLNYVWRFDWNGDGQYEQFATMTVDPAGITLNKDGEQIYPVPMMDLEIIITGNGVVKIGESEYTSQTVQVPKNGTLNLEAVAGDAFTKVESILVDGEKVDELPTSISKNTKLEVNFVTEYDITVTPNIPEGVIVNVSQETVKKGENTQISLKANDGYQIRAISINGVAEAVTDNKEMMLQFAPEADTVVEVTMVRVYAITITTNENGTVTVTQNGVSSSESPVIIAEVDGEIVLLAKPEDGYRVTELFIDGVAQAIEQINDKQHSVTLTDIKDYTIEVSFAPNIYNVTTNVEAGQGTITAPETVNHDAKMEFTVTPDEGYEIKEIKVNGNVTEFSNANGCKVEVAEIKGEQNISVTFALKVYKVELSENADDHGSVTLMEGDKESDGKIQHGYEITIEILPDDGYQLQSVSVNGVVYTDSELTQEGYSKTVTVTGPITIDVTYASIPVADLGYLDIESDGIVRQEGNIYVLKPGAALTLTTGEEILRLERKDSGWAWNEFIAGAYMYQKRNGYWDFEYINTIDMKATMEDVLKTDVLVIDNVDYKLRLGTYAKEWDYKFVGSKNAPVVFAYDKVAPTITWTIPEANTNGYYKNAVTLTVGVEELEEYYSGIDTVQYITGTADSMDVWEAQFEKVDGQEPTINWLTLNSDGEIIADVVDNSNKNVFVTVKAVDKAGNETLETKQLLIDKVAPTGAVNDELGIWEQILKVLTFGIYGKDQVTVTLNASDNASDFIVEYYISNEEFSLAPDGKDTVLEELYNNENNRFTKLEANASGEYKVTVEEENRHSVYFRVTDAAGNYTYLNSQGIIVDRTNPVVAFPEDLQTQYNIGDGDEITIPVSINDLFGEDATSSGLKTVKYQIVKDWNTGRDEVTAQGELYSYAAASPAYTDRDFSKDFVIIVDALENNSSSVKVLVEATDNAGNVASSEVILDIDMTAPAIQVDYSSVSAPRNEQYFNGVRTATITITERSNHFDGSKLVLNPEGDNITSGVFITAVDAEGAIIEDPIEISAWSHELSATTPDEDKHIITITYESDANYTFDVRYMDEAGNQNAGVSYTSNQKDAAFNAFTVDKNLPTGTLTAQSHDENGWEKSWDETLEGNLIFGYWAATKITVNGTQNDVTSPIESVEYYVSDSTTLMSDDELGKMEWESFETAEVLPNAQCVVYVKITDMAGNIEYIRTDGLIVDNTAPREETIAPQITVSPQQPVNGIYSGDVRVDVDVIDPLVGNTFAGLKHVWYEVKCDNRITQSGDLYIFDVQNPSNSDLEQSIAEKILVESEKNNSNDVVIIVYAEDNSGNISSDQVSIKIDITAPAIDISYDNNVADSEFYYNADRVATIVITERNFNPEDVKITITNTDGTLPKIPAVITDWVKADGTLENGDDTTYTAKITYSADGDYTFAIDYSDMAGNDCPGVVNAEDTTNPEEFTIDQTAPVINVVYDNNEAENGKYFDANRTATITIVEHNFDIARVDFTQSAKRGGVVPNVEWAHNGDTHVATIRYSVDGDYIFDVEMTDMAGNESGAANYGDTVSGMDFVIDTTFENMISYDGVENGVAYGHDATVIPSININDINLQDYTITLVGVQKDKTVDLTEEVNALAQAGEETVAGIFDIFAVEQGLDGIYTLTLTSTDKAGNQDSEQIVFTVNRFGSVYAYNAFLMELIANGGAYRQSIGTDLVITEYNADKLLGGSLKIEITCDGRPLENVVYSVTPEINDSVEVGESGWYQYKYTISKDNFTSDGVYKISVSSEDATGNTPENSNYEDLGITFRVDSANAEITSIVGLEERIINAQSVTVKYTIFDTIGLKSIKVFVDGKVVDEITDFSQDMNNYNGSFVINEADRAQSVQIVVEDMSGNITDTSAENFISAYEFNDSVTVSTNFFVRWYANPWLFWGSIAGAVALAGIIIFLIIAKRKKKEEQNAK